MNDVMTAIVGTSRDWASPYAGKIVAITGAGGFIGGRLDTRLTNVDCRVIRLARTDFGNPDAWMEAVAADVVFHLAAQTSSAIAAQNPEADFEANVVPMRRLLAAARQSSRRPVVIFAGTVTQAGIAHPVPVNEDVADDPVTFYDRHKLIAEKDLKHAAAASTVRGASLRLANVYGSGALGHTSDRQILNRVIRTALSGGHLTVYGSGEFTRDYIFIDDVVDAFLAAGIHVERVNGRHFVIGSGSGITIRRAFELVAERVALATGVRVPVALAEPERALSPIDRRHFIADASRFIAATGWRAECSLVDGIDRTIETYRCA
jgi:UDP-glucose 4-epimerase